MNYYLFIVKKRNTIVRLFVWLNCMLALLWFAAYRAIVLEAASPTWFYRNGSLFGKIALILYILTTIPGIMRRVGKFYKPVSILMMFRRYIGITTFMFALIHMSIKRMFPIIIGLQDLVPKDAFLVFGMLAFTVLSALFVTSNEWSVKKMGHWWHVIHNLTYIAGALIFLHVALIDLSVWSVLIILDVLALAVSFVVSRRRSTIPA